MHAVFSDHRSNRLTFSVAPWSRTHMHPWFVESISAEEKQMKMSNDKKDTMRIKYAILLLVQHWVLCIEIIEFFGIIHPVH